MEIDLPRTAEKTESRKQIHPPCLTFHCADECCRYGADVEIEEYRRLIDRGLATADEFTGPEEDEGFWMYRTALGPRGCVFLLPGRGCRLHDTGFKPGVCMVFPRDAAEAKEAYEDGYLPCVAEMFRTENAEIGRGE
jgi:Fe-S-cluster containining protein